jgi:glycosyltransferase involved in cell wall biosynthesis
MLNKLISVFLPDLRGGGVEKMRLKLAKEWIAKGYDVEFILLNQKGELLSEVPNGVSVVNLNVKSIKSSLLPLIKHFKKTKPAVVLGAMWPLTIITILSVKLSGVGCKVFVSDHNTLSLSNRHKNKLSRFIMWLTINIFYPLGNRCIVVSNGISEDIVNNTLLKKNTFNTIYNPASSTITKHYDIKPACYDNSKLNILTVGSLKEQKDHVTLLNSFIKLHDFLPNVNLHIVGEGGKENFILDFIETNNLKDNVFLHEFSNEIGRYYQYADLFVLSSRWEGFGNVIVEALEYGVPVVSTDCRSGPREILENGKYGTLVPVEDVEALTNAMMVSLKADHNHYALKLRSQDFSVDKIAQQYLNVMFPETK